MGGTLEHFIVSIGVTILRENSILTCSCLGVPRTVSFFFVFILQYEEFYLLFGSFVISEVLFLACTCTYATIAVCRLVERVQAAGCKV